MSGSQECTGVSTQLPPKHHINILCMGEKGVKQVTSFMDGPQHDVPTLIQSTTLLYL